MTDCKSLVQELADKYGRERSSLLPILQGVVARNNYLSDTCMTDIAKELDLSAAQVY